MNTNTDITTQAEGVEYILQRLEEHGELSNYIRGLHLHQSVSGVYVKANTGFFPPNYDEMNVFEKFANNYAHVKMIDRHAPWSDPTVAEVIARVEPEYITHELSAAKREEKFSAIQKQINVMGSRVRDD